MGSHGRERSDIAGAPADDVTLVQRAQADPRAFVDLYDRYVALVYAFAFRRLRSVTAAEDATSTIFFNALSALATLDVTKRPFRPWLFAIAQNVVVDHYRRLHRHPETRIDAVVEPADHRDHPEATAIARDEARQLHAAMARLTPEQQHILELRLAGLNGPEIAASLGRQPGAIRIAQHRAFRRLRELLAPEPPAHPTNRGQDRD